MQSFEDPRQFNSHIFFNSIGIILAQRLLHLQIHCTVRAGGVFRFSWASNIYEKKLFSHITTQTDYLKPPTFIVRPKELITLRTAASDNFLPI